jgi:hypothetical protein
LFRETRGALIVKADENKHGEASLETIFRVRQRLDLEREDTAYHYIRRHEVPKVEIDVVE